MVVDLVIEGAFRLNTVIRGLLAANSPQKAIIGFLFVRSKGVRVDGHTILFLLKAFSVLHALIFPPERLHSFVFKLGFESNLIIQTSLLKAYALFGNLQSTFKVFDETPHRDVVQWNALIASYEQGGLAFQAVHMACFMIRENVRPNETTMVSIISSFSQMKALTHGKLAHGYAIKNLIGFDSFVQNALIKLYCRCGFVSPAGRIFEKMSCRNEVSWSTMINGYTENGHPEQALDLFKYMVCSNVLPDDVIVLCVISVCMNLVRLELGKWIDEYVNKNKVFQGNICISNALIDMHIKCGNIKRSCEIFDLMAEKSVVTWTLMIHGLALHGHGMAALARFGQMQREGFRPDEILILGVMSACNYEGMVAEGRMCFKFMVEDCELMPWMEHYGVMVDMLCRAGLLNEAFEFVAGMHLRPDGVIWRTLIRASEEEGRVDVAKHLVELLIQTEPENCENYIMKSGLLAIAEEWKGVEDVRRELGTRGVSKKNPGWSWIEEKHFV